MNSLLNLRQRLGLSQREMADILCIPSAQLSMYELGKRSLPDHAQRLLSALTKGLSDLEQNGIADLPFTPEAKQRKQWELEIGQARAQMGKITEALRISSQRISKHQFLVAGKKLLAQPGLWAEAEGYLDGKIGQDKSRGLALKESILLTNFSR